MSKQSKHRLNPAQEIVNPSVEAVDLSAQEILFLKHYLKTGNVTNSMNKAFPGAHKHPQSAYKAGAKILNANKEILEQVKEKNGITLQKVMKVISEGLESTVRDEKTGEELPDYGLRERYSKTALSLLDTGVGSSGHNPTGINNSSKGNSFGPDLSLHIHAEADELRDAFTEWFKKKKREDVIDE